MTTGPDGPRPPYDPPPYGGPAPSPYGGPPPGPPGHEGPPPLRPDEERLWAIAAHLGPLVLGFVAPLVVWLVFRDRSAFLDRTGKEALNMQISYLIYGTVSGLSIVLLIGLALFPLVMLAWFVLMIVATVKVASWEDYRYPAIIRFVS
jgi:uncharacterized Tic20 family protein